MKVIILSLTLFLVFASGAQKLGSECGMTNAKDERWEETKAIALSKLLASQVAALPTLSKQQIIITAKRYAKNDPFIELEHTRDAIRFLAKNSEDGDVYLAYATVKGLRVTEVLTYPTGDAKSAIFETGTLKVLGRSYNDTIYCE